jgi:hypothetical protein
MSEPTETDVLRRYGRAVIAAMREVLDEADDQHAELLLETADFWLALGLVIGLERPDQGTSCSPSSKPLVTSTMSYCPTQTSC